MSLLYSLRSFYSFRARVTNAIGNNIVSNCSQCFFHNCKALFVFFCFSVLYLHFSPWQFFSFCHMCAESSKKSMLARRSSEFIYWYHKRCERTHAKQTNPITFSFLSVETGAQIAGMKTWNMSEKLFQVKSNYIGEIKTVYFTSSLHIIQVTSQILFGCKCHFILVTGRSDFPRFFPTIIIVVCSFSNLFLLLCHCHRIFDILLSMSLHYKERIHC